MIFNSITFLLFFPVFFILYWFVFNKSIVSQNRLILFSSYLFYGWWDYRFLFLLLFSTCLDFYSGIRIDTSQNEKGRKFWLVLCVTINLGLLLTFKYYNFFIESFTSSIGLIGLKVNAPLLNVVLPVGISFYTFHGLSYIFDIYNRKISRCDDFVKYASFVSFFPLLVAGPIERASHLLPEFSLKREFNYSQAVLGLRQILWGLFKKVVIADNCGVEVDKIFGNYAALPSTVLWYGAVLFSVQIYADFSGYSDIAIGLSKLLGFKIIRNFSFPYFSRNINEFWKRWHISLTSWFRDYLYIPLGGSKAGLQIRIRNVFIIFLVSGLWHGAKITFLLWGLYHALLFLPGLLKPNEKNNLKKNAGLSDLPRILLTNFLVIIGWIFFRSESVGHAFGYFKNLVVNYATSPGQVLLLLKAPLTIGILVMFLCEWFNREYEFGLIFNKDRMFLNSTIARFCVYFAISLLVILNLPNVSKSFIYFQF